MSAPARRTAPAAPATPAAPRARPPAPPAGPLELALAELLSPRRAPAGIGRTWRQLAEFARRPGKRLRPLLVQLGWLAAGGARPVPRGVLQFGAGLELLHAFFLVHDDIADEADTRRGGPALHKVLAPGRLGEQLAVVAGDLLFVEATDALLGCGLPGATSAAREVLAACRDTAAGQLLDIAFTAASLEQICPAAARRAEMLKTARYSFEAPLVAGAILAGAPERLLAALRQVARPLGLAFQLQDDLLPFTQGEAAGKPALADLAGGKKTWMLSLAFRSLDEVGRARLRRALRNPDAGSLQRVRAILERAGALGRARREVARLCALSRRAASRPALASVRGELLRVIERVEGAR